MIGAGTEASVSGLVKSGIHNDVDPLYMHEPFGFLADSLRFCRFKPCRFHIA